MLELIGGCELVAVSAEKEFGDVAGLEARIVVVVAVGLRGQTKRGEGNNIWTGLLVATSLQSHGRAKAEADGDDRAPVFVFKPVQSGENVGCFGSAVMSSLAEASAAKVEAQNRKPETPLRIVDGLHGVVDDLVVEIAAAEGMRMADESGKGRVGSAFINQGFIDQRFEPAGWARQTETALIPASFRGILRTLFRLGGCNCGAHSTLHSTPRQRPHHARDWMP